jgi:hypothetical protein
MLACKIPWEGFPTREAETVFRPYLALHCSGVTQKSLFELTVHGLQAMQVWLNLLSNEGILSARSRKLFTPISPPNEESWLKLHTCNPLPMRQKKCRFGWNRSVMKGSLNEGRNTFSSLSRLALQRVVSIIKSGTEWANATSSVSLVEIGL